MDIIYKKNKDITFDKISEGAVFFYRDVLYMRTQKVNSVWNGSVFNAVNLDTGGFYYLEEDDEVTPATAQLIVS